MSEKKKDEPKSFRPGPVPISEIVPNVLNDIVARAQGRRECKRLQNAFRICVPDTKPEDLIPN